MRYILLILIIISLVSCNRDQETAIEYTTDYFEFENNYWVNLHHFLYQKADSGQLRKLEEDGLDFIEIGENKAYEQLSSKEKEILNQAIKYYKDSLITKSLRRDLNDLRIWLNEKEEFKNISDNSFGEEFTAIINSFSPIYEKHFWEIHKAHNLSVLKKHIAIVDEIENEVINKMERLSLNKWPDSTKVRVDITAYANWAGAYTSSKPKMNIVLSTMDPNNVTSSFMETVLHEGSHLLYLFGESPIRDKFYFKSEELELEFPRNLWHASMFYLCGRATQDALSEQNINHNMLIDEKNIFSDYNTSEFRNISEAYYNNTLNADSMVVKLLTEIKEKSH